MIATEKIIQAAAYARVSTLLGQDCENQLTPIRDFAQRRLYSIGAEYIDYGVSGTKDKRDGLDDMVKDARQGKFKVLIIYSIDRLARNTRHLLNLLNELKHYGVSVISLREHIDFTTPIGQATLTIFGAVAELEVELTRERIKVAMATKKKMAQEKGIKWKCGRELKLTKEVLERISILRAKGLSLRQIADTLHLGKTTISRAIKLVPKGCKIQ